jgi:hypothetical protein
MTTKPLRHYHVFWFGQAQSSPEPHVFCITAQNKAHAIAILDTRFSESVKSIRETVDMGDAVSYITCEG